jgi:hypothetical protein
MYRLSEEEMRDIEEYGIFTGSRAFGYWEDESDWDFVLLESDVKEIMPKILERDELYGSYFGESCKNDATVFINVKCLWRSGTKDYVVHMRVVKEPVVFMGWKFATKAFMATADLREGFYGENKRENIEINKLLFDALKRGYIKAFSLRQSAESYDCSVPVIFRKVVR